MARQRTAAAPASKRDSGSGTVTLTSSEADPTRKEKIAAYIPSGLADSARDAVTALGSHVDDPRTLSELLENALRREVERLQQERNGGRPFPPRPHRKLPAGRRPE